MKFVLSLLALFSLSLNSFASDQLCEDLVNAVDGGMNSVLPLENNENINLLAVKSNTDVDDYLESLESLGISRKQCKGAITIAYFQVKGHKDLLKAYLSTEDYCDGGNTMGAILNVTTDENVTQVFDGDIDC